MGKADANSKDEQREIGRLTRELAQELMGNREPDLKKVNELQCRLDKLAPLSFEDEEQIARNKKEFKNFLNLKINDEINAKLYKQADILTKRKISYKLSRVAVIVLLILVFSSVAAYAIGINLFSFIADFGDNQNKLKLVPNYTEQYLDPSFNTDNLVEPQSLATQTFDDIESALAAMPVMPMFPSYMTKGYKASNISVSTLGNTRSKLDILYSDDNDKLMLVLTMKYYPSSKISDDIGFEHDYKIVESYESDNYIVTLAKDSDENYIAIMIKDNYVYQVYSKIGINELRKIVESFK